MFNTGGYSAEYGQALSSVLILSTNNLPSGTFTNISLYSVGLGISHTHKRENSAIIASYDYGNLSPYYKLVRQNIDYIHSPESHAVTFNYIGKTKNSAMFKTLFSATNDHSGMYYPYYGQNNPSVPLSLNNTNLMLNSSYSGNIGEKGIIKIAAGIGYDSNLIAIEDIKLNDKILLAQVKTTVKQPVSDKMKILYGMDFIYKDFHELIRTNSGRAEYGFSNYMPSLFVEAEY
jgi:hypothetical protein